MIISYCCSASQTEAILPTGELNTWQFVAAVFIFLRNKRNFEMKKFKTKTLKTGLILESNIKKNNSDNLVLLSRIMPCSR